MKQTPNNHIAATYDLIVVGGGLTGVCAAIAAARNGAKVALVHDRPVLGGNASSEIRMHVCGATNNMKKPELSEGGILHELMLSNKRVNDSYNFSIWDAVLFDAAKREGNLTVYLNTTMISVDAEDGAVKKIECYQLTTEHRLLLSARFFADCTGNGTLCAFAGAEYRTGTEGKAELNEPHAPETANNDRMGNTLLFKAVNMGHPVTFVPPVDIMHFTEEQLKYRRHCAAIPEELASKTSDEERRLMFDGFCPDYGYWWIEIPGENENIGEYEDIRDQLVSAVYGVWDHIKNGGDHGAENYALSWVGMLPGTRESRRVECDYMLTETDILENRRFADKVAYGGWSIDHNHLGLFAFERVPAVTYEVEGSYDIPYRSYCVKDFQNLFVGGRCMGASKLAMGSIRVMGTCAIGGQAIGTAAALLCRDSKENIRNINMRELQQTLIKDDCYLPELVNEDPHDLARHAKLSASDEMPSAPASNILSGTTRRIDGNSHQWCAPMNTGNPPWLRLDWEHTVSVEGIQITFDSNFNVEKKMTMSSRRQSQQVLGIPKELIRDYELVFYNNGRIVATHQIKGNYQRLNRIRLAPIECDAIQINILKTNGDPQAKIFEVRVY